MARILFTFLGTAGYQPCRYRFTDGGVPSDVTRFFPYALIAERVRAGGPKIDEIVLCGTQTSGWAALVDALDERRKRPPGGPPPKLPALSLDEIEAFADRYTARLHEVPVKPVLISFARDAVEQTAFVHMVARHVKRGDTVEFDITHGLRHLPVVALTAAIAVRALSEATVKAIWYGAYDMREVDPSIDDELREVAPVVRLDGLLETIDWLEALNVFNASGDMAALGRLVGRETGGDAAERLAEISFRERVLHPGSIRETARGTLAALEGIGSGVSALVRPELERRLAWARGSDDSGEAFAFALRFAEEGGETRALQIAYEATVERIAAASHLRGIVAERRLSGHITEAAKPLSGDYRDAFFDLQRARHTASHPKARAGKGAPPPFDSLDGFQAWFRDIIAVLSGPVPAALSAAVRGAASKSSRGGGSGGGAPR